MRRAPLDFKKDGTFSNVTERPALVLSCSAHTRAGLLSQTAWLCSPPAFGLEIPWPSSPSWGPCSLPIQLFLLRRGPGVLGPTSVGSRTLSVLSSIQNVNEKIYNCTDIKMNILTI